MVSVRVLLLCLTALQTVWAIPLPMFLPFGPDSGDTELQRGNDVSASVNLAANIPFLGLQRETITVRALSVASVCVCVSEWCIACSIYVCMHVCVCVVATQALSSVLACHNKLIAASCRLFVFCCLL